MMPDLVGVYVSGDGNQRRGKDAKRTYKHGADTSAHRTHQPSVLQKKKAKEIDFDTKHNPLKHLPP